MSPIAIRATARSASCRYGLGAARSVSAHRRAAGVPEQIGFPTKPELALAQVDQLLTDDLPRAPLAAEAGHGSATGFREASARCPLPSASCGIRPCGPRARTFAASAAPQWSWTTRPALGRDPDGRPVSVRGLALGKWCGGSKGRDTTQSRLAVILPTRGPSRPTCGSNCVSGFSEYPRYAKKTACHD